MGQDALITILLGQLPKFFHEMLIQSTAWVPHLLIYFNKNHYNIQWLQLSMTPSQIKIS